MKEGGDGAGGRWDGAGHLGGAEEVHAARLLAQLGDAGEGGALVPAGFGRGDRAHEQRRARRVDQPARAAEVRELREDAAARLQQRALPLGGLGGLGEGLEQPDAQLALLARGVALARHRRVGVHAQRLQLRTQLLHALEPLLAAATAAAAALQPVEDSGNR